MAHPEKLPLPVIVRAQTTFQVEIVRELFKEYAASLSFNLCFQSFEEELARLPGEYAFPSGELLLGLVKNRPAGCVALHRLEGEMAGVDPRVCEMKRLYVRPGFRGCGVGRELIYAILNSAATIGYRRMRLDTVPSEMAAAVEIYRKLGFVEIAPYRPNPIPGAKYMELKLEDWERRFPVKSGAHRLANAPR
jgi:carbonic anhydrase